MEPGHGIWIREDSHALGWREALRAFCEEVFSEIAQTLRGFIPFDEF
jgi:hypothetical protein